MCNSYNNGHCNYYGVEVMELNYKCERGECMDGKSLMDAVRQTIDHMNKQSANDDPYKRKVLIGVPNQIKFWKTIYGDDVDYIESPILRR